VHRELNGPPAAKRDIGYRLPHPVLSRFMDFRA
jgi:hypothetical protein